VARTVEHQVTKVRLLENVPVILLDGKPLDSHGVVDRVGASEDLLVSILVRVPNGFLRLSTNVKKEDGGRAVGTFIPNDSPMTAQLLGGKAYFGRGHILNICHVTAYLPVFDRGGRVVATLFVGLREKSYGNIMEHLKKEKLLDTRHHYVLDKIGVLVLHPTLQGKNVLERTDVNGQFIIKEILKNNEGVLTYD
jgi:methyl-accepting chemotaxis protein